MPSTESYIGSPSYQAAGDHWLLNLDPGLTASFVSICEMVTTIFEAAHCTIYANFPQVVICLAESGVPAAVELHDQGQLKGIQTYSEVAVKGADGAASTLPGFRVVSPIVMPSGLLFGWFVFDHTGNQKLDQKDQAILKLLHKDVVNHLVQSKQVFATATANSLQTLITEHNEDWIFVKDEQFRIVYANNAFLDIYPANMRDRVIGYTTVEEYDEAEANVFLTEDKVAFAKGISKVIEDIHMPSGKRVIVETVKRRFTDESGKPYILGICRDITRREELIRELKDANDELGYFTSVASHDLKSPLNAIRRLLDWIEQDCKALLPEEHVENIQLVVGRAARMQTLLDDLLTYARIGKDDSAPANVNLKLLCEDLLQLLDVPEGFSITVPDAALHVAAVPFETVMLNLLSNAIKHNDKDLGRVDVDFEESLHYYHVKIKDNGPGIESQYFDKIFQLFQTLRPRDEIEGSGIGLSVVMKYVSNFGGKIDVKSDGATWTLFTISWPKRSH